MSDGFLITLVSIGVTLLFVIGVPLAGLFLGSLWDGILTGEPLSWAQARMLRVDPAAYVDVEVLTASDRLALRDNWVIASAVVLGVLSPVIVGLAYALVWLLQRINQILRTRKYMSIGIDDLQVIERSTATGSKCPDVCFERWCLQGVHLIVVHLVKRVRLTVRNKNHACFSSRRTLIGQYGYGLGKCGFVGSGLAS